MDGIVIAINPIALDLGFVTIRWYGIAIALGIAQGIGLTAQEARRRGISEDAIYSVATWSIAAALIGARVFHVVDRIDFYIQNPLAILALNQGGLAIWGGTLTGILVGVFYCRRARLPVATVADIAAPGILIGQIIGRLGCIVNGDAFGGPLSAPWAFTYVHADALIPDLGVPTHPYPLYEIVWNGALLIGLWRFRRAAPPPGVLFLVFLIVYGVGRFLLTFVRQETIVVAGLQQAQAIAIIVVLVAVPLLLRQLRPPRSHAV
ncbi:MAG: prolipoprotein diacylglyceryl transferase [Chloroflexota bacterium]|nr:MAG: prolipoprotein diacylglyceryl transferase [Chloroflexota bacterium]